MNELLTKIASVTGARGVLTGDEIRPRQRSWLGHDGADAIALVRPSSTEELSKVMQLCSAAAQPVVPLGGNTGLVDGALATGSELFISLERMNVIESIDASACTMIVQAGVPLQKVQECALEAGLLFALDLGARGSATIGGNISTNAGGNQVIRHGMAREQQHILARPAGSQRHPRCRRNTSRKSGRRWDTVCRADTRPDSAGRRTGFARRHRDN
jgi:FAD/FMN-containing dehydrogenase